MKSIRDNFDIEEFMVMLFAINIGIPMSILGGVGMLIGKIDGGIIQLSTLALSIPIALLCSKKSA